MHLFPDDPNLGTNLGLGTTPENLSRAFAALRAHGVTTSGSTVVVTDPMRLAAFSVPDETG